MVASRFDTANTLYCFKVTYESGEICYYIDINMENVARSAERRSIVESIEYIGKGAIGA